MNKKITLTYLFIFLTLSAPCVQAQSFENENNFQWKLNSGGDSITITKYIGENTDVHIPPRIQNIPVTAIGNWSFYNKRLSNVIIPDTVTVIEDHAFCDNNLTSIDIPKSVVFIGDSAFSINPFEHITIPNSVKYLGESAFSSCKLISVDLPDSLTHINSFAFFNNKLENVIIPNSVTSIGRSAFSANSITYIIIPNSVKHLGENAFSSNLLTSVEIPDSITVIESGVFSHNRLRSVIIPDSITEIHSNAFTSNMLKEVIVPNTAEFLPVSAFDLGVKIYKRKNNNKVYSEEYPVNLNFAYSKLDHRHGILNSLSKNETTGASYFFNIDLYKYNIISADTNIGLFLSPLQYTFMYAPRTQILSFVNAAIYLNLLRYKTGMYNEVESILGPFFSVNWLNIYNFNEFDVKDIEYSAGFLWSWKTFGYDSYNGIKTIKSKVYNTNYFSFEAAYKNINGKDYFYIGAQIGDPLIFFAFLAYMTMNVRQMKQQLL